MKMPMIALSIIFSLKAFSGCPAPELCEKFELDSYECSTYKKMSTCKRFVQNFGKLLEKHDCKRSFDKEPVPAIWLCAEKKGAMMTDLHYKTLSTLKFASAQKLFSSKKLKNTLDGATAEEYKKNK